MANHKLTNIVASETDQLKAQVADLQLEYRALQLEHVTRGMTNPTQLRHLRRNIARILTELRVREIAG